MDRLQRGDLVSRQTGRVLSVSALQGGDIEGVLTGGGVHHQTVFQTIKRITCAKDTIRQQVQVIGCQSRRKITVDRGQRLHIDSMGKRRLGQNVTRRTSQNAIECLGHPGRRDKSMTAPIGTANTIGVVDRGVVEPLYDLASNRIEQCHSAVAIHAAGLEIEAKARATRKTRILVSLAVMTRVGRDNGETALQWRLRSRTGRAGHRTCGRDHLAIIAAVELMNKIAIPRVRQGQFETQRIGFAVVACPLCGDTT